MPAAGFDPTYHSTERQGSTHSVIVRIPDLFIATICLHHCTKIQKVGSYNAASEFGSSKVANAETSRETSFYVDPRLGTDEKVLLTFGMFVLQWKNFPVLTRKGTFLNLKGDC